MPTPSDTLYKLPCPDDFSPEDTLFCGQCFRFFKDRQGKISGVADNHVVTLWREGDQLFLQGCQDEELSFWTEYFDFSTDYTAVKTLFSKDETLARACAFAPGIRVPRQEPWETLCTFIISQNNNIGRITGIIERLCQYFGEPLQNRLPSGKACFSFPSPQRLASLSLEDLAPLRAGFRGKYILDAARKVSEGVVDLDHVAKAPLEEARAHLMQIKGVGIKVADCSLLYGFHKTDAFPIDIWIKRVLEQYYPQGFPQEFYPYRGLAQQFLFHYIRHLEKN